VKLPVADGLEKIIEQAALIENNVEIIIQKRIAKPRHSFYQDKQQQNCRGY
jgi:hypothetical protein